jgi:hypothetical protein
MATPRKQTDVRTDVFGTVITLNFNNGQEIQCDTKLLADNIKQEAILLAVKNKLVDAAAIPCDRETGRSASIEDKVKAVMAVYLRITRAENPQWNANKTKSEAVDGSTLLVRALMQMSGKTKPEIEAQLESMTKEQKLVLKKNAKVAKIIMELQLAGKTDSEDLQANSLLAGFGIVEGVAEPEPEEPEPEEPATKQAPKRAKKTAV